MTDRELLEEVARAIWNCDGYTDEKATWDELPKLMQADGVAVQNVLRAKARAAIAIVVERCERLACDHWHFADVRDEGELVPIITICQEISASIRALICPPPGGHVPGTSQEPESGATGPILDAGGAVAVLPANTEDSVQSKIVRPERKEITRT